MSEDSKSKGKVILGFIGCFIFFASFIIWIFIGCYGFFGTYEGLLGGSMLYGLKAEINIAFWLCVFPIVPVSFLYELIFGILYIARSKDKKFKKASGIFALAILLFLVTPCVFWEIRYQAKAISDSTSIRAYLKDTYGETAAREAKIRIDEFDKDYPHYLISTPVLAKGDAFELHYSEFNGRYQDNLENHINWGAEGFNESFNSYLDGKYHLPSNMHFEASFDGADLGNYHYGDDYTVFFPSAKYRIGKIYVDTDYADSNTLENIPVEIYENYYPLFEDYVEDCFIIIVRIKGKEAMSIQVDKPFYGNYYRATATFYAYKDFSSLNFLNGTVFIDEIGKTVVAIL